jgi:HSP20 family molecular chaperone IbpA
MVAGMEQDQWEMMGILREPSSNRGWVLTRQRKIWRPPTDIYETDTCIVVRVVIAGMQEGDFTISLDSRRLVISGVRRDPVTKVGYQQMEILYGQFETDAHIPRPIDERQIEATYQEGFLSVVLPKAMPRQIPVISVED